MFPSASRFARSVSIIARHGLAAAVLAAVGSSASAATLFSNGPFVTNATGGTGTIAGQPISNADSYVDSGTTFTTAGIGATVSSTTAVADNFTVPAGGWDLDTLTVYAFRTSEATPGATSIQVNLWTAPPYSADSAGAPTPLPQPVLATPLVLPAGTGTLAAYRQTTTGTNASNRAIFAYTVSLDGLPNAGQLAAGSYWMQWSFDGVGAANFFTPLVSPRSSSFDFNARLFNSPFTNTPRQWFEGREGYVSDADPGRAYALPFVLGGVPEPTLLAPAATGLLALRRRRR